MAENEFNVARTTKYRGMTPEAYIASLENEVRDKVEVIHQQDAALSAIGELVDVVRSEDAMSVIAKVAETVRPFTW